MDEQVKTFADYFAMLRRRRVMILMLFMAITVAGVYITYSISPTYLSTASFRIQQQSIAVDVDTPGSNMVDEQIQLVRQRVTSAERLSEVIDKYSLYPNVTGGGPANFDAVEYLRSSIQLLPEYTEVFNQRTSRTILITIAFQIQFEYSDPLLAQAIAAELADLFLSENQNLRMAEAEANIDFLTRALRESEDELNTTARTLADFRERHSGNLPDMTNFNLQTMQRIERSIEAVDADIRAARDRKQVLESELADPNLLAVVMDEDGNPIVGTAQRLADLKRQRLEMRSSYTGEHPEVIRIENEIEVLEANMSESTSNASDIERQLEAKKTELLVAQQQYTDEHPTVRSLISTIAFLERELEDARRQSSMSVDLSSQDPVVQGIRNRIAAQENDIRSFQARRAELVARLDDYERRILRMPQIEREYADLTRDYDTAVARNAEIRTELTEAQTAGRIEAEGGGARFVLTDPPRVPDGPSKPNRLSLLIISVFLAGIASIAAAIARDSMDGTIQDSRDLLRISNAPPIAVIPYIETRRDFHRRIGKNLALSGYVAGCIALAMLITSNTV